MSRRVRIACFSAAACLALFILFNEKTSLPLVKSPGADAAPGDADPRARAALGLGDDAHREGGESESLADPYGFLAFAHREELNPAAAKTLIVTLRFSFFSAPMRTDRRIRLLSKYQHDSPAPPFPGWVIAIRPMRTSIRPEVYWQTSGGKGGWFTFDRFDLKSNKVYDLTLIVKPGAQMSLFLREAAGEGDTDPITSAAPDGFLGGYPLQGIGVPRSTTQLTFSSTANDATVSRIVIAQVEDLRLSRKFLAHFIEGGPDGIKQKLGAGQVVLDYPPAPPEQPEK